MNHLFVFADLFNKFFDAVLVEKTLAFFSSFVFQYDFKPGIQESQFTQAVGQDVKFELRREGENGRVRLECNQGAGVFRFADDLKFSHRHAACEFHIINHAVARHFHLEPVRKRVDTFGTHTVQTTGIFVGTLSELAACVKVRQHEFHRGHHPFRMHVHWNPASVVTN